MRYQPKRAIHQLQGLPGFDKAFLEVFFKRMQNEADSGCSAIAEKELGPSTFKREDIDKLDMEANYETLCSKFPTLMTGMVAVTSKDRCYASAMKVPSYVQTGLNVQQGAFLTDPTPKGPSTRTFKAGPVKKAPRDATLKQLHVLLFTSRLPRLLLHMAPGGVWWTCDGCWDPLQAGYCTLAILARHVTVLLIKSNWLGFHYDIIIHCDIIYTPLDIIDILTIITSGYYLCHAQFIEERLQHGPRVRAEEGKHTRRLFFQEGISQDFKWRLRGFRLPCRGFEGGRRTSVHWSRDVGSIIKAPHGCCLGAENDGLQSRRRQCWTGELIEKYLSF